MTRPARHGVVALIVAAASLWVPQLVSGASATTLTVRAVRTTVELGQSVRISGRLGESAGGEDGIGIRLLADVYPRGKPVGVRVTRTGADGSFSFSVSPDRNVSYRVALVADRQVTSRVTTVFVREAITRNVAYLDGGRVRIAIRTRHPRDLRWAGRRVTWYVGRGRRGRLRRVSRSRTSEPRRGVTRFATVIDAPQGPFRFAACFRAPHQSVMGPPGAHPRCNPHRFRTHRGALYQGRGNGPRGYPAPGAIRAARAYLHERAGYTAFAIVDSRGRLRGAHLHRRFVSASVVKAMLLVAYLNGLAHRHHGLGPGDRAILAPMIHLSDNQAVDAVYARVGDKPLRRLATRARMGDFTVSGRWTEAMFSASDQARFFSAMDRLVARRFDGYARRLLSHIVGYESWGIPPAARPRGWRVFFKGGWRGTGRGQLVHQVARLEGHGRRLTIAVLTDGDPSMLYGEQTIQGVATRLLRQPPPKGGRQPGGHR